MLPIMVSLLWLGRNLKIGYFSQHHVDQLDLNISAVELLAKRFPGQHHTSMGIDSGCLRVPSETCI